MINSGAKFIESFHSQGATLLSHLKTKCFFFKTSSDPILSYCAQIWGLTAKTDHKKIQIPPNKILRIIINAPWFVRNEIIHNDLHIESTEDHIKQSRPEQKPGQVQN
ncbi:hypothetical protein AVEN_52559-1 [Araneus ventricosus]|uniref:Uncharacterized protein n=1 Tax=Araneus ventricosus TaxID=182803 RepID=A0A4Y2SU98_ARAVE|nr:hypothetical protein AVEN_52559-1 [Araneus ventricosus]